MPDVVFPRFAELPVELRLLVWNSVPFPDRVIGLVPYAREAHDQPRDEGPSSNQSRTVPRFIQIAQPSDLAIFPPLHANREARSVWLRRLVQPDRTCQAIVPSGRREGNMYTAEPLVVRSRVPFINYESDTFAVLGAWRPSGSRLVSAHEHAQNIAPVDPFSGLDRSKIRKVGLSELPYGLESAVQAMEVRRLPALEEFSILTLGPDPSGELGRGPGSKSPAWMDLEMTVEDLQKVRCDITNVDSLLVKTHPFFNTERLRHQAAMSPMIRPLPKYTAYVKALLWHAIPGNLPLDLDSPELTELRFDFLEFVLNGTQHSTCPLPTGSCGTGGHGHDEMLGREFKHPITFKMISERRWSSTAKQKGMALHPGEMA